MDKFKFRHAVYKDVQADSAPVASFGKGTVEIETFDNGFAKFRMTLRTNNSILRVLCQEYEIEEPTDGVIGIYLYFEGEIHGEIFLS